MAAAVALAFVLGLVIGSFLNVVAYRLPRGESLAHPPSRCPNCGAPVRPYDNIPVLSWLVLRGRCRSCGHPISARYPLVELTTGLLFAAVVLAKDDAIDIVLGLLLVTALVPIVLIDFEHRLIPNRITLPAAPGSGRPRPSLGVARPPAADPEGPGRRDAPGAADPR